MIHFLAILIKTQSVYFTKIYVVTLCGYKTFQNCDQFIKILEYDRVYDTLMR